MIGFFRCFFSSALVVLSFVVFFVDVDPQTSISIENWINERWSTLTSLGTLVLIGFLTIAATHISNSSAERREANNRSISAELKLVEFRQAWINGLRDDLSELACMTMDDDFPKDNNFRKLTLLHSRIQLRMNNSDVQYPELLRAMGQCVHAARLESGKIRDGQITGAHAELITVSQEILKREWERLKVDLQNSSYTP